MFFRPGTRPRHFPEQLHRTPRFTRRSRCLLSAGCVGTSSIGEVQLISHIQDRRMSRGRGARRRLPPDKPDTESFDDAVLEEVKQLFNKVREYSAPPGDQWCLPDPGAVLRDRPWSHPPLQALKESLNEVKNQLSDKDLAVWHQHTCSTNRAGTVTSNLRDTVNAELCTQAWAKFYEIQGSFQLLPETALRNCELNSVHLCEAPGAFIAALNHFLQTSRLHCDWTWAANTLNPYHEANGRSRTIADDRLIAHTLPWWFFGSDNTGDIMLLKHLLELQVSTIRENLQLFTGMTAEQRNHLDRLRECAAQFYVQRFQVQSLPRKRWVCRSGSLAWGKPCQRKQMGSFNQRKEMQFKEWRQRLAHGPYQAWIEEHFQVEEGHHSVLAGPVAECDLNAWVSHVGAALPKVRSSAFCDPELLDLLNEALEERTVGVKEQPLAQTTPACRSCSIRTSSPASILNELCNQPNVASCFVMVGNRSWQDGPLPGNQRQLRFCPGPSYPEMCVSTLHDGDPLHQHELLSSVCSALCGLSEGSALVVPLCSALTRFTASLVLALHLCFRSIGFRRPVCGPPVVLLCAGFSSVPQINTILQDVLDQMRTLEPDRQLLQFAPMEELIRGSLPHFLLDLNNTVLRQQLHLLLPLQQKR
ncbi:hypothetical protein AMELA_G00143300 [Ameiurus melas]|uniref:Adrift-type SAM-dependent 2'-O-MTase domain-containing protein n=1 Tax=Ameiurus melas TaxID=219545 RepID=A0A7J6ANN2_AMEME|nr:hypothetical protein AMELA_G00143300 [Ameiurus melas]